MIIVTKINVINVKNLNKIEPLESIEAKTHICKLEKQTGPCKARIIRFHFNKLTKRCEKFIWGGCLGNNF